MLTCHSALATEQTNPTTPALGPCHLPLPDGTTSENSGLEDWKTLKDYFPFGVVSFFGKRHEFQANLANHQRGERDLETSPGSQAFVAWR